MSLCVQININNLILRAIFVLLYTKTSKYTNI